MTAPTGKTLFITDLTPGQQVREIFLVARKTLAETKAGKPYLALGLMDRTGEIEARVWDNARELDASAPEGAGLRGSGGLVSVPLRRRAGRRRPPGRGRRDAVAPTRSASRSGH